MQIYIDSVCLFVCLHCEHHSEGKKVVKLQYEAYTPMAVKKIKKVCQDIRVKWPVHRIAVLHRLGYVCKYIIYDVYYTNTVKVLNLTINNCSKMH